MTKKEYMKQYYSTNKEKLTASMRAWYQSNKESVCLRQKTNQKHINQVRRKRVLSEQYFKDLSPEEAEIAWTRMFENQKGKCAMISCTNAATETDHDHSTGKVRGLLCKVCNLLLGKVEKYPWFTNDAAKYLKDAA